MQSLEPSNTPSRSPAAQGGQAMGQARSGAPLPKLLTNGSPHSGPPDCSLTRLGVAERGRGPRGGHSSRPTDGLRVPLGGMARPGEASPAKYISSGTRPPPAGPGQLAVRTRAGGGVGVGQRKPDLGLPGPTLAADPHLTRESRAVCQRCMRCDASTPAMSGGRHCQPARRAGGAVREGVGGTGGAPLSPPPLGGQLAVSQHPIFGGGGSGRVAAADGLRLASRRQRARWGGGLGQARAGVGRPPRECVSASWGWWRRGRGEGRGRN